MNLLGWPQRPRVRGIGLCPIILLFAIVSLSACSVLPIVLSDQAHATTNPKQFRNRQILVTLSGGQEPLWEAFTAALQREYGLHKAGAFPLKSLNVQCLVFTVPANLDVGETIAALRLDKRVEHVQTNQAFDSLAQSYNDPYAAMQRGTLKILTAGVHQYSTGLGVRVAVVDTGVDVNHPDLRAGITRTDNFVDGGDKNFNADAHGTAVAGVIGSRANNGIGIVGIAPDAEIYGYKACWYAEVTDIRAMCSSWTLVKAIDRAILDRAQIINLSLAGPHDVLLERVIKQAMAAKIVVVAAVNDIHPTAIGFPAGLEKVIAVFSSAENGTASSNKFANHPRVLGAPGKGILTTLPDNRYDFVSGSSLAAAHATGVIALMLARNPQLELPEISTLIENPLQQIDACSIFSRMLNRTICRDASAQTKIKE